MKFVLFLSIFIILLSLIHKFKITENYSQAALLQLYAKGPQDTYLTGDAWKYALFWGYPFHIPYNKYGYLNWPKHRYGKWGYFPYWKYGNYVGYY